MYTVIMPLIEYNNMQNALGRNNEYHRDDEHNRSSYYPTLLILGIAICYCFSDIKHDKGRCLLGLDILLHVNSGIQTHISLGLGA